MCSLVLKDTDQVSLAALPKRMAELFPTYPLTIRSTTAPEGDTNPFRPAPLPARFAKLFPTFPLAIPRPLDESPASSLIFKVNDVPMVLLWIDRPTPRGMFDDALATQMLDRMWPDAQARLAQQRAHIVLATFATNRPHQEAVLHATLLTLVAAALADLTAAIAVYWHDGVTITERSRFIDCAKRLAETGGWPSDIWVRLRWFGPKTDGEQLVGIVTSGLLPFVGRELEFAPAALPPYTIGLRVIGVIHYLLSNGPVLRDGHTLGITETERIRVREYDDRHRPGVPFWVMNVEELSEAPLAVFHSLLADDSERGSEQRPWTNRH